MHMYMCVHVCVYMCMCIYMYVYVYMYVCVYVSIYIYVHTRVGVHMHSCRRFLFFLFCPISLLHVRVSQVFLNACMRACEGIRSGFCCPACSWLALVAGVGGYVLAGIEIRVLSCIFLYFCGC